tara:strand:+ start:348 stop:1334 length:987 start_codon:yes stop_codon:yes gene_type:complete
MDKKILVYLIQLDNYTQVKGITLDITPRCTLLCPKCARQEPEFPGFKPLFSDMTLTNFYKIADYFHTIEFCGTFGDAVFHKNFVEMLEYTYKKGNNVEVANAASHKGLDFYEKAFRANPNARWIFGIDGLPKDSKIHRVNQNGPLLFEAMKLARKMGLKPVWQYIIFKYNQDNIDEARKIAKDLDIEIKILRSKRFSGPDDPLKPDDEYTNMYFLKEDKNLTKEEKLQRYFRQSLQPKCLHPEAVFGHSAQGYILPCCWLTIYDVEEKFPELCNPDTHLDNVDSIEEIINSKHWNKFLHNLKNNSKDSPYKCWRKCRTGVPLSKTELK